MVKHGNKRSKKQHNAYLTLHNEYYHKLKYSMVKDGKKQRMEHNIVLCEECDGFVSEKTVPVGGVVRGRWLVHAIPIC